MNFKYHSILAVLALVFVSQNALGQHRSASSTNAGHRYASARSVFDVHVQQHAGCGCEAPPKCVQKACCDPCCCSPRHHIADLFGSMHAKLQNLFPCRKCGCVETKCEPKCGCGPKFRLPSLPHFGPSCGCEPKCGPVAGGMPIMTMPPMDEGNPFLDDEPAAPAPTAPSDESDSGEAPEPPPILRPRDTTGSSDIHLLPRTTSRSHSNGALTSHEKTTLRSKSVLLRKVDAQPVLQPVSNDQPVSASPLHGKTTGCCAPKKQNDVQLIIGLEDIR